MGAAALRKVSVSGCVMPTPRAFTCASAFSKLLAAAWRSAVFDSSAALKTAFFSSGESELRKRVARPELPNELEVPEQALEVAAAPDDAVRLGGRSIDGDLDMADLALERQLVPRPLIEQLGVRVQADVEFRKLLAIDPLEQRAVMMTGERVTAA